MKHSQGHIRIRDRGPAWEFVRLNWKNCEEKIEEGLAAGKHH